MAKTQYDVAPAAAHGPHSFHIPVMGTGFTLDTPLRVARYGISSVISLVDDVLIEQMRKVHCAEAGEPYEAITDRDEDPRARRITAYLDLLDCLVKRQVESLRASAFEPGSEITRYFEMLPETPTKQAYREMLATKDPAVKADMQADLRKLVQPGSIDANIMTKLNRDLYRDGEKLDGQFSDALAAFRGYANSSVSSSMVFSAGMNQRLYSYISEFRDFFPDESGYFKKKICLKVSDYRSAIVQGRFLAKRGLWISEYRVESGLNCGGHAFATPGYLMGPILEEFKQQKDNLVETLHKIYAKALEDLGRPVADTPHEIRITAQGGIGTAGENELLLEYYNVDSTGWGTPFLLVPEAISIDEAHLKKLSAAGEQDVFLSDSSPLGVPFWNLRNSGSEEARRARIEAGRPGSACPKRCLVSDTEFTSIPICRASRAYQERKLEQLAGQDLSQEQLDAARERVLVKSCICHDLGGGAVLRHGIDLQATPAICCGPNIVHFSKIATLEEMVSHVYGRLSLLTSTNRPHMFIGELKIYVDYLRGEAERVSSGVLTCAPKYFGDFKANLLSGIEYYRDLAEQFVEDQQERFLNHLKTLREEIERIMPPTGAELCGRGGS